MFVLYYISSPPRSRRQCIGVSSPDNSRVTPLTPHRARPLIVAQLNKTGLPGCSPDVRSTSSHAFAAGSSFRDPQGRRSTLRTAAMTRFITLGLLASVGAYLQPAPGRLRAAGRKHRCNGAQAAANEPQQHAVDAPAQNRAPAITALAAASLVTAGPALNPRCVTARNTMLRKHLGASVRALGPRGGICILVRNFHECGTLVGAALGRSDSTA